MNLFKHFSFTILPYLCIILIGLILYTATIKGAVGNPNGQIHQLGLDQSGKAFELSPERDRYLLTYAMATTGTTSIPKAVADANYSDIGYYEGKFYILFAPGISVLALPFYLIGAHFNVAQVGTFAVIPLFTILSLLFLYKISRKVFKLPVWSSLIAPLIFGFSSTSWSYATTLYQHQVTTFLIVSSFYAVYLYRQKYKNGWLLSSYVWLAFGVACSIDYPNLLLMGPVVIYLLISQFSIKKVRNSLSFSFQKTLFTVIFFLAIVLVNAWYNQTHFGSWKRVSGDLVNYKTILEQHLLTSKKGTAKLATIAKNKSDTVSFFSEDNIPFSFYTLTTSLDRGLLLYSPIFVIAFLGILAMLSDLSTETIILFGLIGIDVFLYSSWGDPWGGWAFGPRYLIPAMAILSLFAAKWVTLAKHNLIRRIITFILMTYSIAIALLGVLTSNAIPPKVEADYLHTGYNFLQNEKYLFHNQSSSFFYNTFLHQSVTLPMYFAYIYIGLLVITVTVLFVLPIFTKHE